MLIKAARVTVLNKWQLATMLYIVVPKQSTAMDVRTLNINYCTELSALLDNVV